MLCVFDIYSWALIDMHYLLLRNFPFLYGWGNPERCDLCRALKMACRQALPSLGLLSFSTFGLHQTPDPRAAGLDSHPAMCSFRRERTLSTTTESRTTSGVWHDTFIQHRRFVQQDGLKSGPRVPFKHEFQEWSVMKDYLDMQVCVLQIHY